MDNVNNTTEAQKSIDLMGEHLFHRFSELLDNEPENAVALHQEWVVDGKDPEEDDYSFLFTCLKSTELFLIFKLVTSKVPL